MRKIALLVGVEQYRDPRITPLLFATADVLALEARLRDRCTFDEVRVLTQTAGYETPDLHNVLRALDETAAELDEEDLFFFYFSGHGIEKDGRAYLLTADSSETRPHLMSLSKDVLEDTLHHVRARHRALLFDACRNAPDAGKGLKDNLMGATLSRDILATAQSAPDTDVTTALLSACKQGTRAFEWPKWGHGIFTHFLLEGLDGAAWDADGLDFRKLARHTIREVQQFTTRTAGFPNPQAPWYQEFGAAENIVLGTGNLRDAAGRPKPSGNTWVEARVRINTATISTGANTDSLPVAARNIIHQFVTAREGTWSEEDFLDLMVKIYQIPSCAILSNKVLNAELNSQKQAWVREIREEEANRKAIEEAGRKEEEARRKAKEEVICAGEICTFAGIEFCWIPSGKFMMGESGSQHQVTLTRGGWLAKYPVTQAQWEAVMDNNPSYCIGNGRMPVQQVSWDDCQAFCRKLAQQGQGRFRLPTEAEWEYACRAGSTTAYCFGNDENHLGDYAWYNGNAGGKIHPVGRKKPNAWGLHDMHGNIWEWCQDWYGGYPCGAVTDPAGPNTGSDRVARGGCLFCSPRLCRSANRTSNSLGYRGIHFGFRLALPAVQ